MKTYFWTIIQIFNRKPKFVSGYIYTIGTNHGLNRLLEGRDNAFSMRDNAFQTLIMQFLMST